jgi:hypothetical protein
MNQKQTPKCKVKHCRREVKRGDLCYHHEREKQKQNSPYVYWFGVNKRNANRRARVYGNGKFWRVTFDYWVQFCNETGYLAIKGRYKGDASLDCIINELGYIDGNLQVLTVEDNAGKGVKYIDYNMETGEFNVVTWLGLTEINKDDLPF